MQSFAFVKLQLIVAAALALSVSLVVDLMFRSPAEELDLLEERWSEADNLAAAMVERMDTARVPVEIVQDKRRITIDRESNQDAFELLEDVQLRGEQIVQKTVDRKDNDAKLVLRLREEDREWSIFADLTHKPDGWLVRKLRIHRS